MNTKILISALTLCILNISSGHALGISSKLEFGNDAESMKKSNLEIVDEVPIIKGKEPGVNGKLIEDSGESTEEISSSKIKVNTGKSEKLTDKDVVCNSSKCVIEIENPSNGRKTLTDIHVKISTVVNEDDDDSKTKKENKSEDYDVPIFKGYGGVKPEDSHKNKEKNDGGIHVHHYNPSIVRSEDSNNEMPSIYQQLPKPNSNNWHDYLDSRLKPNQKPPQRPQVFHPYNIGNTNNHHDHHNYIPSGWSSSWKPNSPSFQDSNDHYHYNINNKERGFSDDPQYIHYCSCTRKPTYPQRPTYRPQSRNTPRPVNPWFSYETTTKATIDDKIAAPFSNTSKRSGYP